jgi:tetratricopeptide (TPR) repeat protein
MSSFAQKEAAHTEEELNAVEKVEKLKQRGNEFFLNKEFQAAEDLYSQALEISTDPEIRKVLFTNRSAARIGSEKFSLAFEDANEAIQIDPTFLKAYYRKATTLESMNLHGEAYYTWLAASVSCESNETITKQLRKTKTSWSKIFRSKSYPINSIFDLVQRILLFTDKRERLSTLAHFWNESNVQERYSYFQRLLEIIGGDGALSEANQEKITPETMVELPMGNYEDMPRERLQLWFDYFMNLSSENRLQVFDNIWKGLTSEEQNDIIKDLRILFANVMEQPVADLIAVEES